MKLIFLSLICLSSIFGQENWVYRKNKFSSKDQQEFIIQKNGGFFSNKSEPDYTVKFRDSNDEISEMKVSIIGDFWGKDSLKMEFENEKFTFALGKTRKQKRNPFTEKEDFLVKQSYHGSQTQDLKLKVRGSDYTFKGSVQSDANLLKSLLFLQWYHDDFMDTNNSTILSSLD